SLRFSSRKEGTIAHEFGPPVAVGVPRRQPRTDDTFLLKRSPIVKNLVPAFGFSLLLLSAVIAADPKTKPSIPNPAIDMQGYLRVAGEAAQHRETRRLSEEDFLKMSGESGTVVLDARSKEKYDLLHVKGAVNLSFSDITVESLKRTFPD